MLKQDFRARMNDAPAMMASQMTMTWTFHRTKSGRAHAWRWGSNRDITAGETGALTTNTRSNSLTRAQRSSYVSFFQVLSLPRSCNARRRTWRWDYTRSGNF